MLCFSGQPTWHYWQRDQVRICRPIGILVVAQLVGAAKLMFQLHSSELHHQLQAKPAQDSNEQNMDNGSLPGSSRLIWLTSSDIICVRSAFNLQLMKSC